MSFLTSEDYINVGKFFAAINKDYDDFDNTTLNELEQYSATHILRMPFSTSTKKEKIMCAASSVTA